MTLATPKMGEICEVIGITAHPFKPNKVKTLGHALLRFDSGKVGILHCHYMDIPMTNLPFFQVFASDVRWTLVCSLYALIDSK